MSSSQDTDRSYYERGLSGERLRRCYEIAGPRVRRYLDAEIRFTLDTIRSAVGHASRLLELGCGYGRVLPLLADAADHVVGIDTSSSSLAMARQLDGAVSVAQMDASELGFPDGTFDATVCIQNGISAFHVDPRQLIQEAVRVTGADGVVLFSSYADAFWPDRLAWFRAQSAAGLVGEIDEDATGDGVIVCRDGFTTTTVRPDEFRTLCAGVGGDVEVTEVDGSSVFCVIRPV